MYGRKEKKEEEEGGNLFHNMDKASVLQETRMFNETPLNPRKCALILTKILYLINQGEHLGVREATDAFFAMTKLFQSSNVVLRRIVYLCIKEMSKISEDVIIVTSSLTKDMTGKEDAFRGPAIRALCAITDVSMLQSIDRYLKQAIVDKVPVVSSAALTSALHLSYSNTDVVKRWVSEVQEAANADNVMVQYHALGVLYQIRKQDRLALTKLVSKFSRSSLRSPYAYCLLIRIAAKLLDEESAGPESPMFEFIESCLRNKSEIVIFEAAQALVFLKKSTTRELAAAVSVLQLYCSSPKPTLRFAAVRTLNKVAIKHPAAVMACNLDLENLITDVNRSIATLAITTLLKTGSESSIDRLVKQIGNFMNEISDEFKIFVVDAVGSLCIKFPRKHVSLLGFLSSVLREEGGLEYKRAIVNTIISVVQDNPDARTNGLSILCEFIEDCEHPQLAVRILQLLGTEGPHAALPHKYIRFIYNRVILEQPAVRAAAVTALAKFGVQCEELLSSALVLIQRSLYDEDDEVRDRATFYYYILMQKQQSLYSTYVLNALQISSIGLERALCQYIKEGDSSKPFNIKMVPVSTPPQVINGKSESLHIDKEVTLKSDKSATSKHDLYMQQMADVPGISSLGQLFKSSAPLQLTEAETEYGVRCIKHTFAEYILLQFDCTNTMDDQVLEDVYVSVEASEEGFQVERRVRLPQLRFNSPGTSYTLIRLPLDPTQVSATLSCTLKFHVKDCDPTTGEPDGDDRYEDEYVLEDVDLSVADHMQGITKASFQAAWAELGEENELEDTFLLASVKSIEDAVLRLQDYLGLVACERSEKVPSGKSSHVLLLAGIFRGGHDVLARCKLIIADGAVNMSMSVRASDPDVAQVVASAVG